MKAIHEVDVYCAGPNCDCGYPKPIAKYCPRCASDDIYYAEKGTANDDCFECGRCEVLLPVDELLVRA